MIMLTLVLGVSLQSSVGKASPGHTGAKTGWVIKWKKGLVPTWSAAARLGQAGVTSQLSASRNGPQALLETSDSYIDWIETDAETSLRIAQSLRGRPEIEYFEPNFDYTITSLRYRDHPLPLETATSPAGLIPTAAALSPISPVSNDPLADKLWGLGPKGLNILPAWEISRGRLQTVVAVVDTGIDYHHPDLINNLWTNTLEDPAHGGKPGVDDDHNGYTDDVYGINAIADPSSPQAGDPLDDNSHGTHVSGTIAAEGGNNIGVVGVAPQVRILSCKFLNGDGGGKLADVLKCLDYIKKLKTRSVDPVRIIVSNNSWGGSAYSQALKDGIAELGKVGVLFVAAAGNDTANNDFLPSYPANYDLPNLVSVAASNATERLAYFSNYGKRSVHVTAPGDEILSTVPLFDAASGYGYKSGTSMATPHVVGVSALIDDVLDQREQEHLQHKLPKDPPELISPTGTASDLARIARIKNLLLSGNEPIEVLNNLVFSRGLLRAAKDGGGAVDCRDKKFTALLVPHQETATLVPNEELPIQVLNLVCEYPGTNLPLIEQEQQEQSDSGRSSAKATLPHKVVLKDNGVTPDAVADDGMFSASYRPQKGSDSRILISPTGVIPPIHVAVVRLFHTPDIAGLKDHEYQPLTEGETPSYNIYGFAEIPLPFPVLFGGQIRSGTLFVSPGGFATFEREAMSLHNVLNTLPKDYVSTVIAPFWTVLKRGQIFYQTFEKPSEKPGTPSTRQLVIEWRNAAHLSCETSSFNFQLVFNFDNPKIEFRYGEMRAGKALDFPPWNVPCSVDSGTAGIQVSAGRASTFTNDRARLRSFSSLVWRPEPWPTRE